MVRQGLTALACASQQRAHHPGDPHSCLNTASMNLSDTRSHVALMQGEDLLGIALPQPGYPQLMALTPGSIKAALGTRDAGATRPKWLQLRAHHSRCWPGLCMASRALSLGVFSRRDLLLWWPCWHQTHQALSAGSITGITGPKPGGGEPCSVQSKGHQRGVCRSDLYWD